MTLIPSDSLTKKGHVTLSPRLINTRNQEHMTHTRGLIHLQKQETLPALPLPPPIYPHPPISYLIHPRMQEENTSPQRVEFAELPN